LITFIQAKVDLAWTLQEPAIFSDSVNFHNENKKPEMEISSWDFKTASTSNNEPLPQGQVRELSQIYVHCTNNLNDQIRVNKS